MYTGKYGGIDTIFNRDIYFNKTTRKFHISQISQGEVYRLTEPGNHMNVNTNI